VVLGGTISPTALGIRIPLRLAKPLGDALLRLAREAAS
jgi:hypothetical protein